MKTENEYLGCLEIETPSGDHNVWEVERRGRVLVVGTACNVGLLEIYRMTMEDGETFDAALSECYADLQVEATDGARYMSRLSGKANA
jgi:hypothetical protein